GEDGAGVDGHRARGRDAEGDPQLAGGEAGTVGIDPRAHRLAGDGAGDDAGGPRLGDDGGDARPGGHAGGGDLGGDAAGAEAAGAAGAEQLVEDGVGVGHRRQQLGVAPAGGVGGVHPGGVGEQHQDAGVDQVPHDGGEAVVVAEAQLVDDD